MSRMGSRSVLVSVFVSLLMTAFASEAGAQSPAECDGSAEECVTYCEVNPGGGGGRYPCGAPLAGEYAQGAVENARTGEPEQELRRQPLDPNDPVGGATHDPSVDDPFSGPVFLSGAPLNPGEDEEAGPGAFLPEFIPGLPSDCGGYAAPIQRVSSTLTARGRVRCARRAFIGIRVCVAQKRFGVSFFSFYRDISCGPMRDYFTAITPVIAHGIACPSGRHKYRTHVHITISRGSMRGSGGGYQAGRLDTSC